MARCLFKLLSHMHTTLLGAMVMVTACLNAAEELHAEQQIS